MLKIVAPVSIGAAAAEALGCAARGRGKSERGTVVQRLVRRAQGKTEIRIAQTVVRDISSGGGSGAVYLCGDGLSIGEVERHAQENAEMLVEVIARIGIQLEHPAIRVHRSLKGFEARESFLRFRRGLILPKSGNGNDQN